MKSVNEKSFFNVKPLTRDELKQVKGGQKPPCGQIGQPCTFGCCSLTCSNTDGTGVCVAG